MIRGPHKAQIPYRDAVTRALVRAGKDGVRLPDLSRALGYGGRTGKVRGILESMIMHGQVERFTAGDAIGRNANIRWRLK